jgi:hypothetical protein
MCPPTLPIPPDEGLDQPLAGITSYGGGDKDANEAARFYATTFPVRTAPADCHCHKMWWCWFRRTGVRCPFRYSTPSPTVDMIWCRDRDYST